MQNQNLFKGKRITVVGLGKSGLAAANLLYELGANVSVTEIQDNDIIRNNVLNLASSKIKVEIGSHTRDFIRERDIIVVSPGVPREALPIKWAEEMGISVIGEIELAWLLCEGTVIAVTGTNGKTTVTTLIANVLKKANKSVFLCGNIGVPFVQEVKKIKKEDFVCLEVSSFQLETIKTFKPKIAVILNISRNHLDRYKNLDDYFSAKKRIFMNQDKDDFLVLNYEDSLLRDLYREAKSKVVYFYAQKDFNLNQSAVFAVSSILNIEREIVLDAFKEFKGIEHRLEYVAEFRGIKFINDSKSTTVEATLWALNNLDSPIILIVGGREKGNDYSIIKELVKRKVKSMILIGEAKEKIKKAFLGIIPIEEAEDLESAVKKAYLKAESEDTILFSPMCKSFDMFLNFEERGKTFKEIVYRLIQQTQ